MRYILNAVLEGKPLHRQPPAVIYNLAPAIRIEPAPPHDTSAADQAFERVIRPLLKNHSVMQKRKHWRNVTYALARAVRRSGCVYYSRDSSQSDALLNVIDCAIERGLVASLRSPPGRSPSQSRLIPLRPLITWLEPFCPPATPMRELVEVRRGDNKSRLPYRSDHPVAAETQRKLALIREVNSIPVITYQWWDRWEKRLAGICRCRPQHIAYFTDCFDLHGRMYGDDFSHQCLRKVERATIIFDDQPGIEFDFAGFTPRLLYNISGLEYSGDPYDVWPVTTGPHRLLSKKMMAIAINTRSKRAAVAAFNNAKRISTKQSEQLSGEELEEACDLHAAQRETGLSPGEVYDAMMEAHAPIAHFIGKEMGLQLMRRESRIALNVLHHFALQGVPCLGIHDSFIVPAPHADELYAVMGRCYRDEMNGFSPVIKGGERSEFLAAA